jgi:hypothetical protein
MQKPLYDGRFRDFGVLENGVVWERFQQFRKM